MTTKLAKRDLQEFERKIAELRAARSRRVGEITAIIRKGASAAVAVRGIGPAGKEEMAIVSPDIGGDEATRVTWFGVDGPYGHETTNGDVAEKIADHLSPPYEEMSEQDVIDWTTTPEFEKGSRVIAFVQAENTLRWFAQKAGRSAWASDVIRRANEVGTRNGAVNSRGKPDSNDAIDEALEIIAGAIRELPTPNPTAFVRNPAWVTSALADNYELLDAQIPQRWMPQLASVSSNRKHLLADLVEYGCGAYGCVLATRDPKTVLKVTTDDTEVEFAADLSPTIAAPICVEYKMVVRLAAKREKSTIHLLWRESAQLVGDLESVSPEAAALVDRQHSAGQEAYKAVYLHKGPELIRHRLAYWLGKVREMGVAPELASLSQGILHVWDRQHILFGDIHVGNLGLVIREEGVYEDDVEAGDWVITDPGHVAVIADPDLWPDGKRSLNATSPMMSVADTERDLDLAE